MGLSVARELRKRYPFASVAILEKESKLAVHASGRNSGVIHTGVYYGNTTLKAKVCASGAARMREFADEHGIAYKKTGKVIIASSEKDLNVINLLLRNAKNNGVNANLLDEKEIKEIEPYASPFEAGIFCPDTAVIDGLEVVSKLKYLLELEGVKFFFNISIKDVNIKKKELISYSDSFYYSFIYNCAGAGADLVAKKFGFAENYTLIPFKGLYYKVKDTKKYLVRGNIYPVPDMQQPFLGLHLTKVISGDIYIGPTAMPAFGRENYGIFDGLNFSETIQISRTLIMMYIKNNQNFRNLVYSESKKYFKSYFFNSAKKLVNSLASDDIEKTPKVGIRPQIVNTKTFLLETDFLLEKDISSIHVLNTISPAFTSAFKLAELIVDQAEK